VASKVLLEEEKNLGGRPPIMLTDEQKNMVQQMAKVSTVQQIADYLGIHRTTFFDILNRDHEVSLLYKKGRVEGHYFVAGHLMKKIKGGDTTAMIFYLKTQSRWKEPTEEPQEKPVKIETPEEKAEKLREDRLYMEWRSQRLKEEEKENIK
jgi:DNA-binding CsgD family transcriptional regulator